MLAPNHHSLPGRLPAAAAALRERNCAPKAWWEQPRKVHHGRDHANAWLWWEDEPGRAAERCLLRSLHTALESDPGLARAACSAGLGTILIDSIARSVRWLYRREESLVVRSLALLLDELASPLQQPFECARCAPLLCERTNALYTVGEPSYATLEAAYLNCILALANSKIGCLGLVKSGALRLLCLYSKRELLDEMASRALRQLCRQLCAPAALAARKHAVHEGGDEAEHEVEEGGDEVEDDGRTAMTALIDLCANYVLGDDDVEVMRGALAALKWAVDRDPSEARRALAARTAGERALLSGRLVECLGMPDAEATEMVRVGVVGMRIDEIFAHAHT